MSDEAWVPTYEKVEPHSLCCAECKKAREEAARLRDGLRHYRLAHGTRCTCSACDTARALLAEGGAARPAWGADHPSYDEMGQ